MCINRWVLQTAWYQYKQQYKDPYDVAEDKRLRHIAYRQLARWCWGILGKEIRVVLPSCAVMCIRNFYPPPGPEEEFVSEGFRYAGVMYILLKVNLPLICAINGVFELVSNPKRFGAPLTLRF